MTKDLIVSETFLTIQGEGPSAGRRCSFVRLGRCNLDCRWCDTPYTWDWHGKNGVKYDPAVELKARTPREVLCDLEPHDTDMLVVTGGEPMLQQPGILALVDEGWFQYVEIETNGTRALTKPFLERPNNVKQIALNVSPKLASSGCNDKQRTLHFDYAAHRATFDTRFKFVITHDHFDQDLLEVEQIVEQHFIDRADVWLMPEATNHWQHTSRLATVASAAIGAGYNVSGRLHVAAWGNMRGV